MLPQTRRRIIKILAWTFGSLLALILILFTVIQIYITKKKPTLVKLVNEKLNEAISGEASIRDIDVNVWSHFPNVSIRLMDVDIKDSVYKKSLLKLRYAYTKLNPFKLIGGQVDIHNISLEDGVIHLFKDANGFSNNYIFKKNKEKKPGAHPAIIDEIELKNIHFVSEDAIKNKWYGVKANYIHASLDYNDSITTIDLDEDMLVRGLGFNLAKGYFLKGKQVKGDWKLTFNSNSKQLSFGETP